MDGSAVGDYLRARREQLRPDDVGLAWSGTRRVTGLRREEVAALAGISPEYYLRLEQGRDTQPSDQVISALAAALRLDAPAAEYLYRLVHPKAPMRVARTVDVVDEHLLQLIEQWPTPAMVIDACQDVLAVNSIGSAASPEFLVVGMNLAMDIFTDIVKQSTPNWEELAASAAAALRLAASPDNPRLIEIVGELSIRDPDFSRLWARHDVLPFTSGAASMMIGGEGLFSLRWQNLSIPGTAGHMICVFFPEPGTEGEEALRAVAAGEPVQPPSDSTMAINRSSAASEAEPGSAVQTTSASPG